MEDRKLKIEKIKWRRRCQRLSLVFFYLLFSIFYFLNSADANIKDVKPPVDIPGTLSLLWLLLVLLAIGGFLFLRWRQQKKPRAPIVVKTPWEQAYEELQELERRNLFGQGQIKEYFSRLSAIVRRYIEKRFDIQAPEMTTEEFLNSVKNAPGIEARHKEILKNFLVLCDMVKFAKYGADEKEARQSFELVKRFVNETKDGRSGNQDISGQDTSNQGIRFS